MAVSTTDTYSGPYAADGVAVEFPFTFKAASAAEVRVAFINELGVEVAIAPTSYTVTIGSVGGTVLFPSAPTGGDLYIFSDPSFLQEVSFFSGQPFRPETINDVNDRSAARALVLRDGIDRSLQVPFGEAAPALPSALDRRGKLFGFDMSGDAVALDPDIDFDTPPINDYGPWSPEAPFIAETILPEFLRTEILDLRRFGLIDSATMDQTAAMEGVAAYVNATPNGCAINWPSLRINVSRDIYFTKSLRLTGANPAASKLLCRDDARLRLYGLRTPYASTSFSIDNIWVAAEGLHGDFPISVEYQDGYDLPDASLAPTLMMRDMFISGKDRSSGFVGGIDLLNVPWPKLHNVAILGDQDGKTSEYGLRYRGKHGSMHAEGLRTYFVETGADISGEMEGIVFDGYCEMVAVRTGIRYADSSGGLQPYCAIANTHINAEKANIRLEGIDQFAIGQGCSFYGQPFDGTETSWTAIELYASTATSSIINSAVISDCVINGDGQAVGKTRTGIRVNGGASYEDFVISNIRMQGLEYGLEVGANVNGLRVPDTSSTRNVAEPVRNLSTGRNLIQGLGYRYSVDMLPVAAEYPGARVFVLNSSVNTFGAPVAGGGTGQVPVYADPITNQWRVG